MITPTAEIHEHAWGELFAGFDYTEADYLRYIDGKPRYDGVRSFLASRDIELAEGDPSDPPGVDTVCALGNRKNELFNTILERDGIEPYPSSAATLELLAEYHVEAAIVSSSKNARSVLDAAGLGDRFEVVVDGTVAAVRHIAGKPAPDMFTHAADAARGHTRPRRRGRGRRVRRRRRRCRWVRRRHRRRPRCRRAGIAEPRRDVRGRRPGRPPATASTVVNRHEAPIGLPAHRFPVDPWRLVEQEYSSDDLGTTETLFALGNGYLGMRANPEEGREAHSHGTYLNGFHETWQILHAEDAFGFAKTGQTIVNVPDAKLMKLYVDDEPLLLAEADLDTYERTVDFRNGVLTRDMIWRTPSGKRVRVSSQRMVSLVHRHLAVMSLEVTLLDSPAPIVISSQLLNRQDGEDEYHVRSAALGEGKDPRQARKFDHRVLQPRLPTRA